MTNVKGRLVGAALLRLCLCAFILCLAAGAAVAQPRAAADRIVVIKVDGLPYDMMDGFVRERDPRTGKSLLPWIDYVFYQRGTRVANFYVRGMSLSGPSWSLLDTGQHLQIKGNVEFDRYTLHTYDYLNFVPFWVASAGGARVDMPGVELLDEVGVPLLADAFPNDARYLSFQLYQRGARWTTLQRGLQNRFTSRSPRELFDEWVVGFGARGMVTEQLERELTEKLQDPKIRYLDLYTTEFDHATHHNRDRAAHLAALQDLDAIVGRIWMAIQKSPLAARTALTLVSDHGTNSDERVYSQGYNLVKLLGSREGGGHHVVTKRRLLNDYALKGIYPLIPQIYTTTPDSYYLKGQSTDYPTALLDFDGNERASIHLRDSDLNLLHILLQQLQREDLGEPLRRAATAAFFSTLERRRADWQRALDALNAELGALHRLIDKQAALVASQPKKWTPADIDAGRDRAARREAARLDSWRGDEQQYLEYARTLSNLLALRPETFHPARLRIEDLIARRAMGEPNSLSQLQHYVVGPAPAGLVLAPDGSLDIERSFLRLDYLSLLCGVSVRNEVQPGLGRRPIDFVAIRLAPAELRDALAGEGPFDDAIWLDAERDRQALILTRTDERGRLWLRYLPVSGLRQEADGRIRFERAAWRADLPLRMFEDEQLALPDGQARTRWLDAWHTDLEWLRAAHRTHYSNAVVSLQEELAEHVVDGTNAEAPGLTPDERLMRAFRLRQRRLVQPDLLLLANDHWNFDVRGFNPGGNHGSFFRVSTHATLMFAGGEATGIPRGLVVEEPYDSLSFAPTVLALTGRLRDGRTPLPALWQQGFRTFQGRVIGDIFGSPMDSPAPIANTAAGGDKH